MKFNEFIKKVTDSHSPEEWVDLMFKYDIDTYVPSTQSPTINRLLDERANDTGYVDGTQFYHGKDRKMEFSVSYRHDGPKGHIRIRSYHHR